MLRVENLKKVSHDDPREKALRDALYRCLGSTLPPHVPISMG